MYHEQSMNPASAGDSLGWLVHPPHAVRVAADRTRGLIAVQITDLSGGGSGVHWAKPPGGEHRRRARATIRIRRSAIMRGVVQVLVGEPLRPVEYSGSARRLPCHPTGPALPNPCAACLRVRRSDLPAPSCPPRRCGRWSGRRGAARLPPPCALRPGRRALTVEVRQRRWRAPLPRRSGRLSPRREADAQPRCRGGGPPVCRRRREN